MPSLGIAQGTSGATGARVTLARQRPPRSPAQIARRGDDDNTHDDVLQHILSSRNYLANGRSAFGFRLSAFGFRLSAFGFRRSAFGFRRSGGFAIRPA